MSGNYENENPIIYEITNNIKKIETFEYLNENEIEEMTSEEIFGLFLFHFYFKLFYFYFRTYSLY